VTRVRAPPYVIEYSGSFRLPASPDEVWSALGRFDRYEEWWSWLTELRVDGPGLEVGAILDGTVVPPLPYRMRVQVTLVECTAPRAIRAVVAGDLRGQARLLLAPRGLGDAR
jgi:carbon monoxide dehydrogenase subunit G